MSTDKQEPTEKIRGAREWCSETRVILKLSGSLSESGGEKEGSGGEKSLEPKVKPKATINWVQPPSVVWVTGGFELGKDQLNATVDPPGLALKYAPAAGTKLAVNTHELTVSLEDTSEYDDDPQTVNLVVGPATPELMWDPPAAQDYVDGGFVLTKAQLNATVSPGAGELNYKPALGEKLGVGKHKLQVSADASATHGPISNQEVEFEVRKAKAVLTWATPAPVVWQAGGFELGMDQLNATVDPPGLALKYSPAAGTKLTVNTHELTVSLEDTTNYEADPQTVSLVVGPATPELVWNPPDAQDYVDGGFVLTKTQLNATVSPGAGELKYKPALGEKLGVGKHKLQVSADASATHGPISNQEVEFEVRKAKAVLTWATPATVVWKAGGFELGKDQLTATVVPAGLVLKYSPASGSKLNAEKHELTVSLEDTTNYEADPQTVSLVVGPATPELLWEPPDAQDYVDGGFVLTKKQLNAAISPGAGKLKYKPDIGEKLAVGKHKLKVSADASDTHAPISLEVDFEVRKKQAVITWNPPPAGVKYVKDGFLLSKTELSATVDPVGLELVFEPAENTALTAGTHKLKASLKDKANYNSEPVEVDLIVNRAMPKISWPKPAIAVFDSSNPFTLKANTSPLNATRDEGESALVYSPPIGTILKPGEKGKPTKKTPVVPLLPKTWMITATHPESANYQHLEKSMPFTIVPSVNAKEGFDIVNKGGSASFKTGTAIEADVQNNWDKDVGGVKSKATELVSKFQNMTGDEIIEHMNSLVTDPGDFNDDEFSDPSKPLGKLYCNKSWKLPNGIQVRYKKHGDPFSNPNEERDPKHGMFAVEIRKTSLFDFADLASGGTPGSGSFSTGHSDTAGKVSANGELAPWGPGQTTENSLTGNDLQEFLDATTQATHHKCSAAKVDQKIDCLDTLTIPHGTALAESLFNVRYNPGKGPLTLDPPAGTVLALGTTTVKLTSPASPRFNVATKDVTVTVEKLKPKIRWKTPADLPYVPGGAEITGAQLDAEVIPVIVGQPTYTPKSGDKLDFGVHSLKAEVVADANREAATATVKLTVVKAVPVITLKVSTREEDEAGQGVVVREQDVLVKSEPMGLNLEFEPAIGTRLLPGNYTMQVRYKGDANYRSVAEETQFTVTPKGG